VRIEALRGVLGTMGAPHMCVAPYRAMAFELSQKSEFLNKLAFTCVPRMCRALQGSRNKEFLMSHNLSKVRISPK